MSLMKRNSSHLQICTSFIRLSKFRSIGMVRLIIEDVVLFSYNPE